MGDVAAKEEIWEVAAQLLGLASSVALLTALEAVGHEEAVVPAWAAVQGVHVALRYAALASLRFPYPNQASDAKLARLQARKRACWRCANAAAPCPCALQKRAALLVSQHVGSGSVPSVEEANLAERHVMLLPPSACRPRVVFGCTLDEALGGAGAPPLGSAASMGGGGSSSARQLQQLVELYGSEQYLLTWRDGTAYVLLQEGAAPADLLRAMWQAAWLEAQAATPGGSSGSSSNGAGPPATKTEQQQLAASLAALQQQWPSFAQQAVQQGWELDKAVLPRGRTTVRLE